MTRALLALAVLTLIAVPASGADFVASSPTPASFAAAVDFNTVAVAMTNPGGPLHGTVSLQATASSDRGIDRVRFQSSPAGAGTWTDACQDASAPYACDWNTAGVADGSRDLRAVAVDQAGYQRTSVLAPRVIDNTLPAATLNDPGPWLQDSESLTATGSDALSGLASLAIEYRPAGGGAWTELCTGTSSPRNCTLPTATLPDGSYELRARAADAAGNVRNGTTLTRTVDNTSPTVSVPQPGPLRGTVDITIDASDGAGTGIDSVTAQFRTTGGGAWTDVCTDTTTPYACTGLDTTAVPDGLYEARALAVDETGRSTTSAVITVRVDNTAPAATSVTTTNAGTAGRLGNGDTIRLTWTEQIAPASVLGGWTGTSQAITVRVTNSSSNDRMDFHNAGNTTRLNLVNAATDLELGGNYVNADRTFTATMVQSGASITITLGTPNSTSNFATVSSGTLRWRPSASATDLAGNPGATTQWTEAGATDQDF